MMRSMSESKSLNSMLFLNAIEEKARWIPHHTYMRYPPKNWEKEGYYTITFRQYADAINKVAYWLDAQLGASKDNDTIAYFGPNDPRYGILMPATAKTGRKLLILDGRTTDEGLKSLVSSTKCRAWLYAEDDTRGPLIGVDSGLQICALPSLEWCLDANGQERYPYEKTFGQAARDRIAIIHTSGTTGVPKPIYHTNGMWNAMGMGHVLAQRHWPRGTVEESWMGKSTLVCCPPQWLAGLIFITNVPVRADTICIMLPSDVIGLPPDVFKKVIAMNWVDGLVSPPHSIATLYENPETNSLVKSLDFIAYLGAALDRAIGDDLCQHTKITPLIGSTETGNQVSIRPTDRKLWYTHDFVPENGSKMVPVTESDLYELVLERPDDGSENIYQAAFWNPAFEGIKIIKTMELYTPIKDVDGRTRWTFTARKDDLTKLQWLAKFHAQDIEARIQHHPDVQNVCVGGEGRLIPYVILEPKEGVLNRKSREQLLEEVYVGVIERTNAVDNQEIRIPRETVLIAKKEKPLKLNLKQVVLRKEVEKDYMEEIEQAYSRLDSLRASTTLSK